MPVAPGRLLASMRTCVRDAGCSWAPGVHSKSPGCASCNAQAARGKVNATWPTRQRYEAGRPARTTSRPRSRCSARCCCRRTPSRRASELRRAADDFYKPAHGHIFDAITSLYGAGEPVDPVTVADELRRAGLLDAIGGQATLVTPPGQHAGDDQRGALRQDRRGERAAAADDLGRRRDRRARRTRSPTTSTKTIDSAESMVFAGRRAPGHRHAWPSSATCSTRRSTASKSSTSAAIDHRHPHRLPRPRRAALRVPADRARRRRRAARDGQDGLRARASPRPPALEAAATGAVVLARDEPARAHAAASSAPRPGSTATRVRNGKLSEADWEQDPQRRRSARRTRRSSSTTTRT